MALEGTIKDFGLPDIFQLIGLQRKTGVLALNNGQESVTVTFENGMVVMADSSAKRLEDRLGNVLVKQGKLSRDKLEDASSRSSAGATATTTSPLPIPSTTTVRTSPP